MSEAPTLWDKMMALADTPAGAPYAQELREKAIDLAQAAKKWGEAAQEGSKRAAARVMAAWMPARQLYCKITGEPLV